MSMSLAASPAAKRRHAPVPAPGRVRFVAANDDDPDRSTAALQRAALRLLAEHGSGYGEVVAAEAEQAFFANRRAAYRWWILVGRTLDTMVAVGQRPAC